MAVTASMVLLGLLQRGPGHGYELKAAHDDWFPSAKPLAFGQVYATLGRLVRDGLVESVETRQEGGPERIVYALTDDGRQALQGWLAEPEAPATYAAEELVRKTVTALRLGVDQDGFLDRQQGAHADLMRALTAQRSRVEEPGARIALEHRLAHLDADLRWMEETRARIRREQVRRSTRSDDSTARDGVA
jgi:DNA-binding PadR family transcriptional regulator